MGKSTKKPWSVRIVEALGWTYVALYAGGLIFAFCELELYCRDGFVDAALTVGAFFAQLCLPIGMVVALRKGRRAWFLWTHTVLVAILAVIYIFASMEWFVVIVAVPLIAVPIALLFRPEASLWFNEKLTDRKPDRP